MKQLWNDHSYSISCTAVGATIILIASALLESGKLWDVAHGAGLAFWTAGAIKFMEGPFYDKNKVEEKC